MKPEDRKRLEALGFSPEVIAKTEEVLCVWEMEEVFVEYGLCGKPCFHPDIKGNKHRRKKLPADLFAKTELLGFPDKFNGVICWACDEEQFQ